MTREEFNHVNRTRGRDLMRGVDRRPLMRKIFHEIAFRWLWLLSRIHGRIFIASVYLKPTGKILMAHATYEIRARSFEGAEKKFRRMLGNRIAEGPNAMRIREEEDQRMRKYESPRRSAARLWMEMSSPR